MVRKDEPGIMKILGLPQQFMIMMVAVINVIKGNSKEIDTSSWVSYNLVIFHP